MAKAGAKAKPDQSLSKQERYTKMEEKSYDPEDIAKVVERNIVRCFGKPVPAAAIDVVEIDGKNMRAQMIEDRTALLASGRTRADPTYFGAIKNKYMGELMGTSAVVVADESSDLPDALTDALKHARTIQRRDRKREPLVHYLWQCRSALSQAAVIELVDLLVETQQHNCLKHAILVQEVFGTFARLDITGDLPHCTMTIS